MEDIKALFNKLITSSVLSDSSKATWLAKLNTQGYSKKFLDELVTELDKSLIKAEDKISQGVQQVMDEADKAEQDFNTQLKALDEQEKNSSKAHEKSLIESIRAKLKI